MRILEDNKCFISGFEVWSDREIDIYVPQFACKIVTEFMDTISDDGYQDELCTYMGQPFDIQ